jgi:hypothetical protein
MLQRIVLVLSLLALIAIPVQAQVQIEPFASTPLSHAAKTLTFSGYQWDVRSGIGGPGPNQWSDANVWVDSNGYLHMTISKRDGRWYASEVSTQQRLGFGTYTFQVEGRLDKFDRNVVLGLFNYPPPDVGPDTTNEIDIEFARWGNPEYPNGHYTVWPAQTGFSPTTYSFPFRLTKRNPTRSFTSTHRFTWNSQGIWFESFYGLTTDPAFRFAAWTYAPANSLDTVPQKAMPVHINLWLLQGRKPVNGKEVEVVIRSFTYTP